MTEPELLAWAAEEAAQRKTDLAGPMSMFKLHEAKTRATARRKLVGLTRSQATLAISNAQALARQRARREQALEDAKAKERARGDFDVVLDQAGARIERES